jgi:hypothetical protein
MEVEELEHILLEHPNLLFQEEELEDIVNILYLIHLEVIGFRLEQVVHLVLLQMEQLLVDLVFAL